MIKGFSTGSLAYGDFNMAIEMLSQTKANAVELSALREDELPVLLEKINQLKLAQFEYISLHAPSRIENRPEGEVIEMLQELVKQVKNLSGLTPPVIVHPDIMNDYSMWQSFGPGLFIENMDKRKNIGQTASDLLIIFEKLPDAKMCFDLGHARQIDPTMTEGINIVKELCTKIKELHVSDVNSASRHERLNLTSFLAFKKVVPHLPDTVPIIMESLMIEATPEQINHELDIATYVLCKEPAKSKNKELQRFHRDIYGEPADV